jgi:hypothetical protein
MARDLTDVAAWAVRYGFPARIVDAAVRSGLVQSKMFSKAGKELVKVCATSEGRARLLALPAVEAALRDNGWTEDELAAWVSQAEVPEHLLREYKAFQRSDDDLENTIRRRLPYIQRQVQAFVRPVAKIPRPATRPRSSHRSRPGLRLAAAASRDGPSSSRDEDEGSPGLAGRFRAALAGWFA